MIIDKRDTILNCTKNYNNLYNCRKRRFPRGKKQSAIKPFVKALFNSEDTYEDDKKKVQRWEKSNSKLYYSKGAKISELTEVLQCAPYEIYFENIDECVNFENEFLISSVNKFENEFKEFSKNKKVILCTDILDFKRKVVNSENYFYFQIVEKAISICKLFDINTIRLWIKIKQELTVNENLNLKKYVFKYFELTKTFLKDIFFNYYNVFGIYKFCDLYASNYSDKDLKMMMKENGISIKNQKIILSNLKNDDSKYQLQSGNYLYDILKRFNNYNKLSNFSIKNPDKGLEIIAVNNWNDLFKSLIIQLKVNALIGTNSDDKSFYAKCRRILAFNEYSYPDWGSIDPQIYTSCEFYVYLLSNLGLSEDLKKVLKQLIVEFSKINNSYLNLNFYKYISQFVYSDYSKLNLPHDL